MRHPTNNELRSFSGAEQRFKNLQNEHPPPLQSQIFTTFVDQESTDEGSHTRFDTLRGAKESKKSFEPLNVPRNRLTRILLTLLIHRVEMIAFTKFPVNS